jgi:hypothetical protein
MNYERVYKELISQAVQRATVDGYKEQHHIVPKSLGGLDDNSNLVALTAREHFVAHCLLAFIHGGTQWCAITYMKSRGKCFNSRLYEIARFKSAKELGLMRKGKALSKEHRERIGFAMSKTRKGVSLSEAHRKALSISVSASTKGKAKPLLKGKPISNERKIRISASLKGKQWSFARRLAYENSKGLNQTL